MKFITSERSFTNKLWGIVVYKVLKSDGYSNFLKKTVVETLNVCFFVFYFEYHKYIYIYNIYNIIYYIYIYVCVYVCMCVCVYDTYKKNQTKSATGSRMLPCLNIFFGNVILIRKC